MFDSLNRAIPEAYMSVCLNYVSHKFSLPSLSILNLFELDFLALPIKRALNYRWEASEMVSGILGNSSTKHICPSYNEETGEVGARILDREAKGMVGQIRIRKAVLLVWELQLWEPVPPVLQCPLGPAIHYYQQYQMTS